MNYKIMTKSVSTLRCTFHLTSSTQRKGVPRRYHRHRCIRIYYILHLITLYIHYIDNMKYFEKIRVRDDSLACRHCLLDKP